MIRRNKMKKQKDLVKLKTTTHKNIYGVIYKGNVYTCNLYYNDDDCSSFQTEVFDEKENEVDENLFEEVEEFVIKEIQKNRLKAKGYGRSYGYRLK